MRNASFVKKNQVKDLYKDKLEGLVNIGAVGSPTVSMEGIQAEDLEIQVINKIGPYSLVRPLNLATISSFIVPTELVETRSVPTALELFTPILNKIHPNTWCNFTDLNGTWLYILYPEIEITNSLRLKHTIRNLVVRFVLADNGSVLHLQGTRLSATKPELDAGYAHSHLTTKAFNSWGNFCLGSDGRGFGQFFNNLKKVNTPFEFEMFLLQLREYLSWESVEGKPHIAMSAITSKQESGEGGHYPYTASISMDIARKIAVEMLHRIPAKMIKKVGEVYVVDTSTYAYELYIIEKEATNAVAAYDVNMYYCTADFDESNGKYLLEDRSRRGRHDPMILSYNSLIGDLLQKLNVQNQGIIEINEDRAEGRIIRRLSSYMLCGVFEHMNMLLMEATQLTLTLNEQGNQSGVQSESATQQEPNNSDNVPAQSMPEGEGMVRSFDMEADERLPF